MKLRELQRQARKMSRHRCDQCGKYGRWQVAYIDTGEEARIKQTCGSHVTRTLRWISEHRHPVLTDVRVLDRGEEG